MSQLIRQLFPTYAPPSFDFTEPRCRTCTSPAREFIEWCLEKGCAYQFIAERTPPDGLGRKVDRRSISTHYRKHMPARCSADRSS